MQHGEIIAERYRLDRKIGQGGTGSIWLAQDERLDRQAAIKFLFASNPAHQERLAKRVALEAKIAASIQHRNVVQIFDFGTHQGNIPFIVMEALTGHSMGEAFESSQSFSLDTLIHIMSEVLRGLVAVHDVGIVHRDLKPENVFLVHERGGKLSPKLLDFGISRSLEPDTRRSAVTTTEGLIIGTPQYMSPEQARGLGDIDRRTDIYSVGVILFEAIAGFVPFDSENMGDLLLKVIRSKPPSLARVAPQLGPALGAVVDKALAKSRDQRYQDAAAMHDALCAAFAQVPASFDRNALLFPPGSNKSSASASGTGSEFPLPGDSGAAPESVAPPPEPAGERQTRRARRRSDEGDGEPVRKRTPQSGDLTIERGSSEARGVLQRFGPWLLGGTAAFSIIGSIVFALLTRGDSANQSGFIVVQASGAQNRAAPPAPVPAGSAAAEAAKDPDATEAPTGAPAEARPRRATQTAPRTRTTRTRTQAAPAAVDPMQQRATEVANAFSRQKASVIECLGNFPADMEGAPQLTVRLRVNPEGRVSEAVLLPESISGKSVGTCVAGAVRAMTFARQEQATTFRIPLLWRRR